MLILCGDFRIKDFPKIPFVLGQVRENACDGKQTHGGNYFRDDSLIRLRVPVLLRRSAKAPSGKDPKSPKRTLCAPNSGQQC